MGGQGGCERSIEVIVKMQTKRWGGIRVDLNKELNLLV